MDVHLDHNVGVPHAQWRNLVLHLPASFSDLFVVFWQRAQQVSGPSLGQAKSADHSQSRLAQGSLLERVLEGPVGVGGPVNAGDDAAVSG